jgi:GH18 family chitinase
MYMKDKDSEPAWEPTAAVKFNDANIAALQAEGITVTAAIGGWGLDNVFRPATNTSAGREHFAQSLVSFVKAKGLDGIDLDWE